MNKSYNEARLEGRCENCDRDPILCREEEKCLSDRKIYELIIQFIHHSIRLETTDEDEFVKTVKMLEDAIIYGHNYKTLQNYTICIPHILYWKTEEYYG
jgi:hypothetical protein